MSTVLNHLEQLKWRHRALDSKIEEAYNKYVSDEELKMMKHEKFLLKEQIRLLEEQHGTEKIYGRNV